MKKGKNSNLVLKVIEKIARHEVKNIQNIWPPVCMGIYHQPKRPKR